jgi:hypothetical protein
MTDQSVTEKKQALPSATFANTLDLAIELTVFGIDFRVAISFACSGWSGQCGV